jgi:hypothetical protein
MTKFGRGLNREIVAEVNSGRMREHFNVLGKVIRVIDDDKDSINLIRKTALSAMPENILNTALGGLSELSKTQGFKIPTMELEAKGPVLQVLPIAIFS